MKFTELPVYDENHCVFLSDKMSPKTPIFKKSKQMREILLSPLSLKPKQLTPLKLDTDIIIDSPEPVRNSVVLSPLLSSRNPMRKVTSFGNLDKIRERNERRQKQITKLNEDIEVNMALNKNKRVRSADRRSVHDRLMAGEKQVPYIKVLHTPAFKPKKTHKSVRRLEREELMKFLSEKV